MDKNTLSNYGWIVIAVLVLSVMIALATPFGEYIKAGVESTTAGLFDTSEKALNVVGMSAKDDTGKMVYTGAEGEYTTDAYIKKGEIVSDGGMAYTSMIKVEEGVTYYFSCYSAYSAYPVVVMYDSEKEFVANYGPTDMKTELTKSYCYNASANFFDNNYEREINWVTIPKGISYIVFNVPKSEVAKIQVYKGGYPKELHSYTSVLPTNNNLTGKTAIFYGDSIAAGAKAGKEGFPENIAGANNMKYINCAVAGYKLSNFVNQINSTSAPSKLSKADYVIIEGFVNDVVGTYTPLPIGSISAEGTTEFDSTTFTGMLEQLIYDYQQAGYSAKLGFVLTSKPTNKNESTLEKIRAYWDAAIVVFEKYDVNYLDLWNKTYSYADGLHPDFQGTHDMTKDIEIWMNTL